MTPVDAVATTDVDPDEGSDHDDIVVLPWWQHPFNVIGLVVAALLIGAMSGWLSGDSAARRSGNDVDAGFLDDMRTHHEQAVEMALIYVTRPDTDAGLRTVARSILLGQSQDIGRMVQLGRDLRIGEDDDPEQAMGWMGMATPVAEMPGMASEEQLDELSSADGAAADAEFVELMVAHHRGGIEMTEFAAERAEDPEVRALAQAKAVGQADEIVELEGLLG